MTGSVATLGILGAGQLASMLTHAANRIGVDTHAYRSAESDDRCSANRVTTAPLDDLAAVATWAGEVDVVTVETENIPLATLRAAATIVPVRPSPEFVGICQDRLLEKNFLQDNGIAVARYCAVDQAGDASAALEQLGTSGVLKTRRFGYDGKGQHVLRAVDQAEAAWQDLDEAPCIVEELVPFDAELSVIAARSPSGETTAYDPGRNNHREGILRKTFVPSELGLGIEQEAKAIARRILDAHDYVGVLGVEFFVADGELLVNEMAPRVHNSGHWTMDGCVIDQFEQHVRAVMGLPLGSTERHVDVEMHNIIGHDLDRLSTMLVSPAQRIHLYGKRDLRPGRKMGHINRVKKRTD